MSTRASVDGAGTGQTGPAGRPRRDHAALVGSAAAVLGLLVAVVAWLWPQQPDTGPAPHGGPAMPGTTTPATGGGPITTTAAPGGTPSGGVAPRAPAVAHLDGLGPESGGSHVVPVPRPVRATDGFTDHPVAITCPTNQTGDRERTVTWSLKGRYLDLRADVRPWYPPDADQGAVTHVTALVGTRQRDGEISTSVGGRQQQATPTGPQPLTANVEGAEQLLLRVECSDPNGIIILTAATLTPA